MKCLLKCTCLRRFVQLCTTNSYKETARWKRLNLGRRAGEVSRRLTWALTRVPAAARRERRRLCARPPRTGSQAQEPEAPSQQARGAAGARRQALGPPRLRPAPRNDPRAPTPALTLAVGHATSGPAPQRTTSGVGPPHPSRPRPRARMCRRRVRARLRPGSAPRPGSPLPLRPGGGRTAPHPAGTGLRPATSPVSRVRGPSTHF